MAPETDYSVHTSNLYENDKIWGQNRIKMFAISSYKPGLHADYLKKSFIFISGFIMGGL